MIKNYQIFRDTVVNVINNSGLDIGAVKFILRDIMHDVEENYTHTINEEIKKENEQLDVHQDNGYSRDEVNESPSPMSDEDDIVEDEVTE